jgi:hypothetical protein
MKLFYAMCVFSLIQPSFADDFKSAKRQAGESYLDYIAKASNRSTKSVLGNKLTFEQLDFSKITEWASEETLWDHFVMIRDKRFLTTEKNPEFKRRSSWLYPDDGCYARAALTISNLREQKIKMPWKLFIFGDLDVQTDNSESGSVGWWYHVAPIVNIDSEPFVLDPAISPISPLRVKEWIKKMTKNIKDVEFALCSPHSYSPTSNCLEFEEQDQEMVINDQLNFLGPEWLRQLALGRDPEQVLGDNPIWEIVEGLFNQNSPSPQDHILRL